MAEKLPDKIQEQIKKARLPQNGSEPFIPKLVRNRRNESIIAKETVTKGPKKGKKGYVDEAGRIWIKDAAHAGLPQHWDVQIDGGDDYLRIDNDGNPIP